jgi:hypothetical protein
MLKLEVSISLVLGLVLVNAKHLLPEANLDDNSWKASFDVTYTPDSQLSDAASWLAWGDILAKTNTNETLIESSASSGRPHQASSQTSQTSALAAAAPSEGASQLQSLSDRLESIQVAPTQRLWEGSSWSDGIVIDDPSEQTYSESDASIASLLDSFNEDGSQPNLFPTLLPMLQATGGLAAATANSNAAFNTLFAPTAAQAESEIVNMTILPVAVVLNPSSKTPPATLTASALVSNWKPQSLRSAERANAKPKDSFSLSGSLLVLSAGIAALGVWGASVQRGSSQSAAHNFHFHHRH